MGSVLCSENRFQQRTTMRKESDGLSEGGQTVTMTY